jgi:hypothetical protein
MPNMQRTDSSSGNKTTNPPQGMLQRPPLHDQRTIDFFTWQRKTLEQFAQDAHVEIIELRAELRVAIDAYRAVITGGLK